MRLNDVGGTPFGCAMKVGTPSTRTMRRNSNSAVRSPFSVRATPSSTPPCGGIQYSSNFSSDEPPHQWPLIQASSSVATVCAGSAVAPMISERMSRRTFHVSLPMYELYIANKNYSSWSLRPWVLMRERGIAFTERLVHFAQGASGASWKAFRSFSPNGRVPCLRDGERVVWDSLAIAEYLAERHPGLWPADDGARAWARCAAAEMHSGFGTLRERCTFNAGIRVRIDEFGTALEQEIARITELWSEGVAQFGGPFLAGREFTIGRRLLCAGRVPRADLRLEAQRRRERLRLTPARAAFVAKLVRRRTPGDVPRSRARGRGPQDRHVAGGPARIMKQLRPRR